MARVIFEVVWDEGESRWILYRGRGTKRVVVSQHRLKMSAVDAGAVAGNESWKKGNQPAQLVIHERDGTIGEERTYPDTTPQRKG